MSNLKVQIAQDVIKQLDAKLYIATSGVYVQKSDLPDTIDASTRLSEFVASIPPCHVCALGSAILSNARLGTNDLVGDLFRIDDYGADLRCGNMDVTLRNIFGESNLEMIESAFEMSNMSDTLDPDEDDMSDIELAIEFGEQFEHDEPRLRAIMQNIIENEGIFKP